VGDSADGIPGIPTWGAKSSAALLSRYGHIEDIPHDISEWDMTEGRARRLANNLAEHKEEASLYRQLTTLRTDVPIEEGVADLEWRGAREELKTLSKELGAIDIPERVPRWI
jgi:5'-3' exonuclease